MAKMVRAAVTGTLEMEWPGQEAAAVNVLLLFSVEVLAVAFRSQTAFISAVAADEAEASRRGSLTDERAYLDHRETKEMPVL
jgi:hypothetical protein